MNAKHSLASQQMRAAWGDPRRGEIPVELVSSQPSDDFPVQIVPAFEQMLPPGCRGQIGVTYLKQWHFAIVQVYKKSFLLEKRSDFQWRKGGYSVGIFTRRT
jgi:hypothetical protein